MIIIARPTMPRVCEPQSHHKPQHATTSVSKHHMCVLNCLIRSAGQSSLVHHAQHLTPLQPAAYAVAEFHGPRHNSVRVVDPQIGLLQGISVSVAK